MDRGIRNKRVVFASNELPAQLDDRARFSRFLDFYEQVAVKGNVSYVPGRPFFAHYEGVVGDVRVARLEGTLHQFIRTPRHIAADGIVDDAYTLYANAGVQPFQMEQRGRELSATVEMPVLVARWEGSKMSALHGFVALRALRLPRPQLLERVAEADDLILKPFDPNSESLRHLRRYLGMLLETEGLGSDPALIGHVNTTLLDLVALALGAGRDSAELARMRGLRAARVTEIVGLIRAGFANPAFSPGEVARKLGFSPRYINDLLHETGSSFAERVTELRLQRVRAMLSDRRHDRLMVSEIAYECGFNDVSYFNRCFRRRFGASPTQFRGRNGSAQG